MRGMVIAMIVLFLLTPFASIGSNTISSLTIDNEILYVGGDGANNYTSIGEAIDNAPEGATIYVYPGIYHESIVINKQLRLIGIKEDGEKPVIQAEENHSAVVIEADGCVLKGFIMKSKEVIVAPDIPPSCEIRSDNNVIENNTFMYGWCSFYLYESSYNLIKNNEIAKGYWCGMRTKDGANNIIANNIMRDNTGTGLEIWGETGNTITGNIATTNLHGMQLINSNDCSISLTHIYANDQYGLCLGQCSDISILNNTIHSHTYGGLQLTDSSDCTISGNEIYSNQGGVMLDGTLGINYEGSTNVMSSDIGNII